MNADAVFEGGGMRAIGIVGALRYLELRGYNWGNVAGTSAGAVVATLIAAGYSAKEIKKMIISTDFKKFLCRNRFEKVPILGKAIGIIKDKGIYSGEYIERWVNEKLRVKGIKKFKDVSVNGKSRLKIVASDITNEKSVVLPDDLSKYGLNPMNFNIARAVRMSIGIPFYFKPVILKSKGKTSYIVDGGITCNFPISIFDVDGIPKRPTIGFKFKVDKLSNSARGKIDPMSFLFDIADTMTRSRENEIEEEKNKSRTIFIPTNGVESTDFNVDRKESLKLYRMGYRSAKSFLNTWDFKNYIEKYRENNEESQVK